MGPQGPRVKFYFLFMGLQMNPNFELANLPFGIIRDPYDPVIFDH